MNPKNLSLPKWILGVSGFFALMEIMVSVSLFVAPESVLETVDLGAKGVTYVVHMWAVRQFALGSIFAVATFKRSIPMLTLAYIFFLVMFLGDLLIGILQNEVALIVSAVVMCIVSSVMILVINRKKPTEPI